MTKGEELVEIDPQVMQAATELDEAQKSQPKWVWYEREHGLVSFGRWQQTGLQAPYVRADIAPTALSSAQERIAELEGERDEFRDLYLRLLGPSPADDSTAAIVEAVEQWINLRFGGDASAEQITALVVEALARKPATLARIEELESALRPFADFAPFVDMFVEGRAANGGSPVLPTRHFRRSDFQGAADALRRSRTTEKMDG